VTVGSNRIRIALRAPSLSAAGGSGDLAVAFEEQSGRLVASLASPGWLDALAPAPRQAFATALAGLYKRAGVDMVREQLTAVLGPLRAYDVVGDGLVVWLGDDYEQPVLYRLGRRGPATPEPPRGRAPVPREELLFSELALPWRRWEEALASLGASAPPSSAPPLIQQRLLPAAPVRGA
jgi:hypothetical protein